MLRKCFRVAVTIDDHAVLALMSDNAFINDLLVNHQDKSAFPTQLPDYVIVTDFALGWENYDLLKDIEDHCVVIYDGHGDRDGITKDQNAICEIEGRNRSVLGFENTPEGRGAFARTVLRCRGAHFKCYQLIDDGRYQEFIAECTSAEESLDFSCGIRAPR